MNIIRKSECGHIPCPVRNDIDTRIVLYAISKIENGLTPVISANGRIQTDQVLKVEELIIQKDGILKLDIDNAFEWIAIVAKKMTFQMNDQQKTSFKIQWAAFDVKKLDGADGDHGQDGIGKGANGEAGHEGKQGGTRNSPFVYLFIGDIVAENGNINDVDFNFTLDGFEGGRGGRGGNGGNGVQGNDGRDGKNGRDGLFCKRGASNGRDGGNGGYGGRGGHGGCGGDGAIIQVFCLTQTVQDKLSKAHYSVNGGKNNNEQGGPHGLPGLPGNGGDGGSNSHSNCNNNTKSGNTGHPSTASEQRNWHYGNGKQGIDGKTGDLLLDLLDNADVFKNPPQLA